MNNTRRTLVYAILAGISVGLAFGHPASADLQKQARITKEAATRIALAGVNHGQIKSAELEKENGMLIWSFDIATPGTKDITEVWVDAQTGKVASLHKEGPSEQAVERAADRSKK